MRCLVVLYRQHLYCRSNTSKSYIWCYREGGIKPCIVYEYQKTRGGFHAEDFLSGCKGYLQSDAYSGYNFADKDGGIVRIGCMAHAQKVRRYYQENVKIAAMPTLLLLKSIATPELVAHVIVSKYCDHLRLYRQEEMWTRMDIDMPRSSLCG